MFRKLTKSLLSDFSNRLGGIATALESSNMSELVPIVHSLKSASMIVGARRFSALCARVEKLARDGEVNAAKLLAEELLAMGATLPDVLIVCCG